MARLVLLQSGEATPFPITQDRIVLGRLPECEIQLHSNMVSRRHMEVVRSGNDYIANDLKSGNGSFVNGKRIERGTTLRNQDRIKLGPILFRFESDDPAHQRPQTGLENEAISVDISTDDSSTIMHAAENSSGFGLLHVRPEAKLKAVIEMSRALVGTVDVERLLPKLLDTLFSIFPHADRGCVLLQDPNTGTMRPAAQKLRRPDGDETVKLSRTIINKVLEERTGILSADAANDPFFPATESISGLSIRSMMCVPLLNLSGDPVGIINIDTQNTVQRFEKEDLELLLAIAGQAALSYESARLLDSYIQKEKQDNEMRIARNVQQALLPEHLPAVEGYQFFASYESAQAVGGDYYDAMMLTDDKICLSFGDVAGKGVPGALIMSRLASCVQNTMRFVHDVDAAVTAINNHMCAKSVEGRFVTYVLVIIDLNTHEMSLVNAGHMSPLIRRVDGTVDEFDDEATGIPIGIVPDYPYEVVSRRIEPGETVVLITDGVDEAMNRENELYTKARVKQFVAAGSPDAAELGKALLADVRRHANGRPQNDDITIMTFGRNPAGHGS